MNGRNAEVDWKAGIVAIVGRLPSGTLGPVGTGFVVSEQGHIATCAHVVEQADWQYGEWETPLQVRFNANGRHGDALVLKEYLLPGPDIAILSLTDGLPEEARILPLCSTDGAEGHRTYMWGYPAGFEKGLLGQGEVLGIEGRQQLQLTSTQTTHGYSGGPVWDVDWERVIGMISSGSREDSVGRLQYENFAIPAQTLAEASGGLLELTPLGDALPVDMSDYDNRPLFAEMRKAFDMEDIENLCIGLQINFEDLKGSTKTAKARELILHCERHSIVPELLAELTKEREKVDWYAVSGVRLL